MKNKNGFTMIEIVMITIVLGLGILSVVMAVNKIELANIKLAQSVIANNLAAQGIEWAYANTGTISASANNEYYDSTDFCLHGNKWEGCVGSEDPQYTRTIIATGNTINPNNPTIIGYDVCSIVEYEANAGGMAKKELENKICAVVDVEH